MRYKMGVMAPENGQLIEVAKATRRSHDRSKYLRVMSNPVRKVRLRENIRMAQRRRMKNPEYRRRYNEYHKEWMRNKRHETPE